MTIEPPEYPEPPRYSNVVEPPTYSDVVLIMPQEDMMLYEECVKIETYLFWVCLFLGSGSLIAFITMFVYYT